jgi:hypothetical protein
VHVRPLRPPRATGKPAQRPSHTPTRKEAVPRSRSSAAACRHQARSSSPAPAGAALRALQLDPARATAQTGSDEEKPQPKSHPNPGGREQVTGSIQHALLTTGAPWVRKWQAGGERGLTSVAPAQSKIPTMPHSWQVRAGFASRLPAAVNMIFNFEFRSKSWTASTISLDRQQSFVPDRPLDRPRSQRKVKRQATDALRLRCLWPPAASPHPAGPSGPPAAPRPAAPAIASWSASPDRTTRPCTCVNAAARSRPAPGPLEAV